MNQVNQNNVFTNGTLISGISAMATGISVPVRGLTKFCFVIETLNDTGVSINKGSATGTIQGIIHGSQTSWVTLFSTGFNNISTGALFQLNSPFDSFRAIINPYSSGVVNVWYAGSQV